MAKISKLIVFIFLLSESYAQVSFQKTMGVALEHEFGNSIIRMDDGNLLIVGSGGDFLGSGYKNMLLIKTNQSGQVLFNKKISDTQFLMGAQSIKISPNKYLVLGNYSWSVFDFIQIVLINSAGIQTQSNGVRFHLKSKGNAVALSSGEQFAICGSSGASATSLNGLLCKIDSSGTSSLWAVQYGGAGNEEFNSIIPLSDGGYMMAGYTESFGMGGRDIFIIRTNQYGDIIWSKVFGGTGNDEAKKILKASDDGYFITGYTESYGAGQKDVFLIKINSGGILLWSRIIGSEEADIAESLTMSQYEDKVIVGGKTRSDLSISYQGFLIESTLNGDITSQSAYGGSAIDYINDLVTADDGGIFFVGGTKSFASGNLDILLGKTYLNYSAGCYENSLHLAVDSTTVFSNAYILCPYSATLSNAWEMLSLGSGTFAQIETSLCYNVGIDALATDEASVIVYPNPSNGIFRINIEEDDKIEIINLLGKNIEFYVISEDPDTKQIYLNEKGVYFYKIYNKKSMKSGKIIIN
jgi:hypothetical protein